MPPLDQLNAALEGRYRIDRALGAGGMATVYLAHDVRHDRPVAIKVLRPDIAAAIGATRFLDEIRTTANLQHPNILPLFDSGEADGQLYFVMPYVEGETLRHRLDRGHVFTAPEAVRLVTEIAGALDYAHRRGIVHRDIKPENILLQEGRPLVADFGIARASADDHATRATRVGMVIGTPGYMSPEQAAGRPVDGRSDQYSLACVLAELLAIAPALPGASAETTVSTAAPAVPAESFARADVAPAVRAALGRALALDPGGRFPSISAFADALQSGRAGDDKSIAVLPFQNMSADAENEYFADGMAEEIINALTQVPDLRVVARASAFSFKGRRDDLRVIGQKLNVGHILEGSVRKAGQRLRITVQLINAADGYQLWSERYDRQLDDVFAIQDEIATTIAAKLKVTLGERGPGRLVTPSTLNLQAYDEYLKGVALMHRRGAGIVEAIACFRRAIALDGQYAPALAGLAQALVLLCFWGLANPRQCADAASDAARRALAADPNLVDAHVAAALVAIGVEFDRAKAARAWDRAFALGPADVEARATRAVFHLCYVCGDSEAAVREMQFVLDRDPFSQTFHSQLGLALAFGGRSAEAIAAARRAIALDPDALFGRWILILALLVAGAYDEVIEAGTEIMRKFGRHGWIMLGVSQAYAALGRVDEASAIFDELVARSRTEYLQPAVLALIAMEIGRRDEAMRRWAQAVADGDMLMVAMLLHAPISSKVRAEPEHAQLLARMGWNSPLPSNPA